MKPYIKFLCKLAIFEKNVTENTENLLKRI
jgi:hypothetical protein